VKHFHFCIRLEGSLLRQLFSPPPTITTRKFPTHPFVPTFRNPTSCHATTMPFAQLVIGPPGSGKSTYCNGMHQFMGAIGRRCSIVNLDPANEATGYPCALDIRSIVTLEEVMDDEGLGPNGGVMYALEELEENIEWLEEGLSRLGNDYILFDCPGQVELFTHHRSLRKIFGRLQKIGYRVCRVLPPLPPPSRDSRVAADGCS